VTREKISNAHSVSPGISGYGASRLGVASCQSCSGRANILHDGWPPCAHDRHSTFTTSKFTTSHLAVTLLLIWASYLLANLLRRGEVGFYQSPSRPHATKPIYYKQKLRRTKRSCYLRAMG